MSAQDEDSRGLHVNLPENMLSLIAQGDFKALPQGQVRELKPSWHALDEESYALLASDSDMEEIILTVVGVSDMPIPGMF